MLARRLSPEGVDTRRCASKDAGLRRGVDWGVPHRLEKGTSASEDAGPRRGWIVRSYIGWGGERNILYKCMETPPLQTRFKNLESPISYIPLVGSHEDPLKISFVII